MKAKQCLLIVVFIAGISVGDYQGKRKPLEDYTIHEAVISGKLGEIKSILTAKPELVNAKTDTGETPLLMVFNSMEVEKEIVELLIANGADVNAQNDRGETPLYLALEMLDKEIVELLIANGADVNAKNKYGDTLLHSAVLMSDREVKFLIDNGADVNAKGNMGETPLHRAITPTPLFWGKEIIKILLNNGADVNAKDDLMGLTPLYIAASEGHKDIVELLISKGADINAKNKMGGTVLHYLMSFGQEDDTKMIEFLLSKGADINAKDIMGSTPLHSASSHGYKNIVKLLISRGADAFCETNLKATPLTYATSKLHAASEDHNDVADLLRVHMKEVRDLLHAIEEAATDEEKLVFIKKIRNIAPETNKKMGNEFKQENTFDWYSETLIELKASELQFRAIDMTDEADEANKVIASLETAWSQGDWYQMLYAKQYVRKVNSLLKNIEESSSKKQPQQITIDTVSMKEQAERLLAEQITDKQIETIIEEVSGSKNIYKNLESSHEEIPDVMLDALREIDPNSLFVKEEFKNINFEKASAALGAIGLKPEFVDRPYSLSGLSDKKILIGIEIERAAKLESFGLSANAIFSQTKKQLQDYGIKAISQKELLTIPYNQWLTLILYINISVKLVEGTEAVPVNTYIGFLETVQLARSPEKFCTATTWEKNVIQMVSREALPDVMITVRGIVQVFINDYLIANPKELESQTENDK